MYVGKRKILLFAWAILDASVEYWIGLAIDVFHFIVKRDI